MRMWKPILLILAMLLALPSRIPAAVASNLFGFSVSVSGSLMAVGEPDATIGGNANQGAVYLYQEKSNAWTQVAVLTANDGKAGDLFGASVQVYQTTVIVGAPGWPAGAGQGAAYIFVKPASGWSGNSFKAELTASDGVPGQYFGVSVAISNNNAVVGAPGSLSQSLLDTGTGKPASNIVAGNRINGMPDQSANGTLYLFAEPPGGWATMTETTEIFAP